MSHFYCGAQGNRGETTRCGSKSSGAVAFANGWDVGAKIIISYSSKLETDVVSIYATGGSNQSSGTRLMSFAVIDGKRKILDSAYPELCI